MFHTYAQSKRAGMINSPRTTRRRSRSPPVLAPLNNQRALDKVKPLRTKQAKQSPTRHYYPLQPLSKGQCRPKNPALRTGTEPVDIQTHSPKKDASPSPLIPNKIDPICGHDSVNKSSSSLPKKHTPIPIAKANNMNKQRDENNIIKQTDVFDLRREIINPLTDLMDLLHVQEFYNNFPDCFDDEKF